MYAELITVALAATSTLTCPTNNGCTSTATNGAIFQLKCTTNYNGAIIEVNQVGTPSSPTPTANKPGLLVR